MGKFCGLLLLGLWSAMGLQAQPTSTGKITYLFAGSYTNGKPGNGIQVYKWDAAKGRLKICSKVSKITNPSYLTLAPDGECLYACTNTKLPTEGSVTAFKVDALHGSLQLLNTQPSGGLNPVYVSIHPSGKWLVNANYTEGNLTAFPLNDDGSIAAHAQNIAFQDSSIFKLRQEKSHPHAAVFSPDGLFVFVPDLGADKIRVFEFHAAQAAPLVLRDDLTIQAIGASGPRHFTFHPSGKWAYCAEELSGMVAAYRYTDGRLDAMQRIFAYSKTEEIYSSADIHISPDGRFLYVSNRLDDENTIAIFRIDSVSGMLALVGHQGTLGDHPRNFLIDPTGRYLIVANQVTGNIVVFKRDLETGLLQQVGQDVKMKNVSTLWMREFGNARPTD